MNKETKRDHFREIDKQLIEISEKLEVEMWKLVRLSTTAMDTEIDRLDTVEIAGAISLAIQHINKARNHLG